MSLGLTVNPLEDVLTPKYKAQLKAMMPKFLRYPEGATGQNYFWATSPTWQPESHSFINDKKWPATDKKYYKEGKPNMFNLKSFLQLCDFVGARAIIVVPLNPMFADVNATPFEKLVENAVNLVKYVGKRDALYQIGNETTLKVSIDGYTTPDKYSWFAGLMIEQMKKTNPDAKCLVNGSTVADWEIVSKTPKADGVAMCNYPMWSIDKWMSQDSRKLVKKIEDCVKASGGLDVYVVESNSTNFKPQYNNVGMGLMNSDMLLNALIVAPKCVCQWVTRWSHNMPITPAVVNTLTLDDGVTCSGEMLKMILFAISKTCYPTPGYNTGSCIISDVTTSYRNGMYVFTNKKTMRKSLVIINKKEKYASINIPNAFKTLSALYGERGAMKPSWETRKISRVLVMKPLSLNIVI